MHLLDCKIYIQYDKKTDSLGNHYLFKQFIFTDDCVTENELKRKIHFDQQQTQLDFFDWGHVAPPFQRELLRKKIIFTDADVHQIYFESVGRKKIVRNVVHPKNQSILTAIQATYPNAQKVLNIIPLKRYVDQPEN